MASRTEPPSRCTIDPSTQGIKDGMIDRLGNNELQKSGKVSFGKKIDWIRAAAVLTITPCSLSIVLIAMELPQLEFF